MENLRWLCGAFSLAAHGFKRPICGFKPVNPKDKARPGQRSKVPPGTLQMVKNILKPTKKPPFRRIVPCNNKHHEKKRNYPSSTKNTSQRVFNTYLNKNIIKPWNNLPKSPKNQTQPQPSKSPKKITPKTHHPSFLPHFPLILVFFSVFSVFFVFFSVFPPPKQTEQKNRRRPPTAPSPSRRGAPRRGLPRGRRWRRGRGDERRGANGPSHRAF